MVQGQSMGAMYANIISAVEPRIQAVVRRAPAGTGATSSSRRRAFPNIQGDLRLLLDRRRDYTHLHPAMHVAQMGLGPIDPIVFMPRLGQNPLPGQPVRSGVRAARPGRLVLPDGVQNACAMSYGNQEAGGTILADDASRAAARGLEGILPYPVTTTASRRTGAPCARASSCSTWATGSTNPHAIYSQLDAVKYQYGCFFQTMLQDGDGDRAGAGAVRDPLRRRVSVAQLSSRLVVRLRY